MVIDAPGALAPGLSVAAVKGRLGLKLRLSTAASGSQSCAAAWIAKADLEGGALFGYRRLRSTGFTRGVRTGAGIAIGAGEAALRRAYGSTMTREVSEYGTVQYFVSTPGAGASLRFDMSRGRIYQVTYGDESVRFLEGCA